MNKRSDYIAVFDSGVGGISVLRELLRVMPEERYLYFGDSANAPYGTRTTEEVKRLTLAAAARMMERGIKALVVACNTATAAAIEDLRRTYPQTIIVGIEPALKLAVDRFPGGCIGVMATPVTLREEKFHHLTDRFCQDCRMIPISAPGLADLVEEGITSGPRMDGLLRPLLSPYVGKLDAMVLGCTHYPFAQKAIAQILGDRTQLLHGGVGTAQQTMRRLKAADLLYGGPGKVIVENSTDSPKLLALSRRLMEQKEEIYG